jgi:hypothetical protein
MTERRADECAVNGHLRHATGEVVTRLVAVFCDPRCQELLQGSKRTRCEHLGLERVLLELLQVPLSHLTRQLCAYGISRTTGTRQNAPRSQQYVNTHSKVSIGTTALGQGLANVVHEVLLTAGRGADSLLLELDLRHDGRSQVAQLAQ